MGRVAARASRDTRDLQRRSWRHPRWLLAVKTAVAAALAWIVVQPVGGFASDYPYYAPLGAVVVMSTTVVASVRASVQAVCAVALGGVIAIAVRLLSVPAPVAVALVVAVAVLVAGARYLGQMGGWVPTVALFVLIVGGQHPVLYVAAYAGLTILGAGVGVAVNLALPQLPITPAVEAMERLRAELADQLDDLAEGLTSSTRLSADDWERRRRTLEPRARMLDELVAQAMEARRGNWRAPRWADAADRGYARSSALQSLTGCVDDMARRVADDRISVHGVDELSATMRSAVADAMGAMARLLRSVEPAEDDRIAARTAVTRLRDLLGQSTIDAGDLDLDAASITINLQRAVEAWT